MIMRAQPPPEAAGLEAVGRRGHLANAAGSRGVQAANPLGLSLLVRRLWFVLIACCVLAHPAAALKPVTLTGEQDRIDITRHGEAYDGRGDALQIETAAGPDGATGRMGVRASTPGTNPNWLVFALHNPTDKVLELWLTADRYSVIGSGVIWPDLDARRIEAVTHSAGFVPERVRSDRADIFRLTIERGQTVTYVAELSSERVSRVDLWRPLDYEQRLRDQHLFNGIMLGITGILAVFLTTVFAANHKIIFPSAALVSWCVLALLCVDFGFWHKLFQMRPEDNAQYRAAAEAAVAASLVIFLFAFLRVNLWHGFARMLFGVWITAQLALIAVSVLDAKLAATVARSSLAMIGVLGTVIISFLAARGLDRALALVPTWILFLVWLFGAGVALTGQLAGEVVTSGLVAGLVLILLLIGFTVTQFAFRSNEPLYGASPNQRQLRLAAIDRAGVAVWEWSTRRDEIRLDPEIEATLGLAAGELPTKREDFVTYLHPADRERFELGLTTIKDSQSTVLKLDLRLRHSDSSYRWFEFEGASVPTTDSRALRCVGLVRDVTDAKRAQERLMHDAVHDSLTGLPNRELFLDRLNVALARTKSEPAVRPTVFFFDIDKFRSVNSSFGLIVGDSILLTVARRLARNLQPQDTLGRIGGDQFALLLPGGQDARHLAVIAERLRLALRSPIRIAGQEIVLTGSIGVTVEDGTQTDARDLLREAEVAMRRAKRAGSDRIEIFRAEMRGEKDDRVAIESDLRSAIKNRQLHILYQPIVTLSNEELVGFEALVRWHHPRLGPLAPADFVPVAEETDLIVQLGSFVLNRAVADLAQWQKDLPRPDQPLFVNVNVSSRQLIKPDLVQEVRHVVGRAVLVPSTLRLEITESLVMENPEQATHVLELLKEVGVGLALDDFGTGYSSLAYLNRFPFDTIKIDKALVQASSTGESNAIIVRSIVALAHELGKTIVAEGVETPEDATYLRSIGCHSAQGFYYGEPMPEAEIGRLLKLIRKADRRMRRRGMVRGQDKKRAGQGVGGDASEGVAYDAARAAEPLAALSREHEGARGTLALPGGYPASDRVRDAVTGRAGQPDSRPIPRDAAGSRGVPTSTPGNARVSPRANPRQAQPGHGLPPADAYARPASGGQPPPLSSRPKAPPAPARAPATGALSRLSALAPRRWRSSRSAEHAAEPGANLNTAAPPPALAGAQRPPAIPPMPHQQPRPAEPRLPEASAAEPRSGDLARSASAMGQAHGAASRLPHQAASGAPKGGPPARPANLERLPPGMAASLVRLAGSRALKSVLVRRGPSDEPLGPVPASKKSAAE